MSWSAQSPDLKHIKNSWHRINVIIAKEKPSYNKELIKIIIRAWHHFVALKEICNLVHSIRRLCKTVIQVKEYPTKHLQKKGYTNGPFLGHQ